MPIGRTTRTSLRERVRGVALVTLLGLVVCAVALAIVAVMVWLRL